MLGRLCAGLLILPALAAAERPVTLSDAGRQPRVAVGIDGTVACAWGEPDLSRTVPGGLVVCRVSPDGGKTWNAPVTIARIDRLALGMRRGPQVAVAGSWISVLAISHDAGDVLAWRSADRGVTWTGPVVVNDVSGSAREGMHAVAAAPGGPLLAVWLDHRGAGTTIRSAGSADGGGGWEPPVQVYASPAGHVCECCHPFVTADAKGRFHVLFRNWLDGSRDIWTTTSSDGGGSFAAATRLGTGTWPLEGCPMAGPWAAPGRTSLETVWKREGAVYAARPGAKEAKLAEADQPVVASGSGGVYRMWMKDTTILLQSPGSTSARRLAPGQWPAAASAPDGRGPVIAAWQAPADGGGVIVQVLSARR